MDPLLKKYHDELTYMFMQFLKEEGQISVLRKLEQDSAIYFNQGSLWDFIAEGNWDEAEKYISAFTTIEDIQISNQIYFLIRKQKFLEALYKLCWQHSQCKNPKTPPEIRSLFIDHNCDEQGAAQTSSHISTENGIETRLPKEERD